MILFVAHKSRAILRKTYVTYINKVSLFLMVHCSQSVIVLSFA
jgi:hypothetical protein